MNHHIHQSTYRHAHPYSTSRVHHTATHTVRHSKVLYISPFHSLDEMKCTPSIHTVLHIIKRDELS
jgi:DUF1365 family protein